MLLDSKLSYMYLFYLKIDIVDRHSCLYSFVNILNLIRNSSESESHSPILTESPCVKRSCSTALMSLWLTWLLTLTPLAHRASTPSEYW